MRVLVIKAFIDKQTSIPYNAGYWYESDDLERIRELQELGYLEKVPWEAEEQEQAVPVRPVRTSRRRKA